MYYITHSHVWHESTTCGKWLIHMCVSLIHSCDITHSNVQHDSSTCLTWLIHICDMTDSHVWHDSFTCGAWLIHMWCMTHSHVWHDSFTATHYNTLQHTATRLGAYKRMVFKGVIWTHRKILQHTAARLDVYVRIVFKREVGGWGRVPFSRNLMSPTPRRKWYLTTGRRFH